MKGNLKEQKQNVLKKLYQFEQSGLQSYKKYLLKERENALGKDIKKYYLAYIEKEIVRADKKLAKLAEKLN